MRTSRARSSGAACASRESDTAPSTPSIGSHRQIASHTPSSEQNSTLCVPGRSIVSAMCAESFGAALSRISNSMPGCGSTTTSE
ncbi:MAG: hypothetical protein BWY81_01449 [Firmicutes bacterium ADurb.Bin467]|nr:MAG: hypothetical protein BWY81_01449 [Firmicutes bacterium ADurb.Bin467]